jgi:hypothetical protein
MDAHALTKKAGPLPVWGWALLGGGGLGLLILTKKGKTSAGVTETPEEAAKKQQLEELVQGLQNAASAGGVTGGATSPSPSPTPTTPEAQKAATPEPAASAPAPVIAPVETPAPATPAPPPLASASTAPAAAHPSSPFNLISHQAGNPRSGITYRLGTFQGMAAHIYSKAVPGGVGPNRNAIVLNAGKKTHAKKGAHQHAKAKGKGPTVHHVTKHAPAKPAHKPATARHAAPKKKISRRPAHKTTPPKRKIHG